MSKGIGKVETRFHTFGSADDPFVTAGGAALAGVTIAYETYGELNADRSNAVVLFHALSGSQHAAGSNQDVPGLDGRWTEELHTGWWDGFVGPGRALDTNKYFIIWSMPVIFRGSPCMTSSARNFPCLKISASKNFMPWSAPPSAA
jgi:homoserine O-acetyltransferase/O-succinyltransferase